ncbi:hypothetical protein E2C01_058706 [Portunus trituberculatus]|uniref:Uncharacterized protein n=1 Tax=Portunus trituberculatus TaxID=210409 RepID=A0A5B7H664_PORTR|nr:hypothetical protein [Portunus trituberculatus]
MAGELQEGRWWRLLLTSSAFLRETREEWPEAEKLPSSRHSLALENSAPPLLLLSASPPVNK